MTGKYLFINMKNIKRISILLGICICIRVHILHDRFYWYIHKNKYVHKCILPTYMHTYCTCYTKADTENMTPIACGRSTNDILCKIYVYTCNIQRFIVIYIAIHVDIESDKFIRIMKLSFRFEIT